VPTTPSGSGEAVVIEGGSIIVKVNALDVLPAGLATVTLAVPRVAMSPAGIEAVSLELLTNVVVRLEPLHFTVAPERKFEPLTVRVNSDSPAVAELGLRLVSSGNGSTTVRENSFVALPGVG
jgi:hypothetical protein